MKPSLKRLSPCLAVLLLVGCADLALESDHLPAELEISPRGGLIAKEDVVQLEVVIRDQNGEEMTVPSWAPVVWNGSDESVAPVTGNGMLSAVHGGEVVVSATLGELGDAVRFRINPSQVVLTAPTIYLTQAAQNARGLVLLIAGRPALIRVFMTGDETSYYGPAVRVSLFQGDTEVFREVLSTMTGRTPSQVVEGELDGSVNGVIPGSVIQPGVAMVVELDPEGVVPLAPGSQTRYPAVGATKLKVAEPQLFRQIMVPTISVQSPDESVYDWTDDLNPESPQVRLARTLMPAGSMELEIHETYRTGANSEHNEWMGRVDPRNPCPLRTGGPSRILLRRCHGVVTGLWRSGLRRLSGERRARRRRRLCSRTGAQHEPVARPLREPGWAGPELSVPRRSDRDLGI